jgi:hypothetical protein
MNQELQALLDKVDANFRANINKAPTNNSIHGAIDELPAIIRLDTKICGALSYAKPQVLLAVIIGEVCVARWGCIDDDDTEQLLAWWLERQTTARDNYYEAQQFPQQLWDHL